jgi:hypothetical protein
MRAGTGMGMIESSTTAVLWCFDYVFSSLFSLTNKRKSAPFMERHRKMKLKS